MPCDRPATRIVANAIAASVYGSIGAWKIVVTIVRVTRSGLASIRACTCRTRTSAVTTNPAATIHGSGERARRASPRATTGAAAMPRVAYPSQKSGSMSVPFPMSPALAARHTSRVAASPRPAITVAAAMLRRAASASGEKSGQSR